MDHAFYMRECLRLAEGGRHLVGNGALVGSVLVRDGKVIAEGYYKKYGDSHAERGLLEKFDQEIRSSDILYVSLEPCCHTGKTPPCTDIILKKGIKHVVFGMMDPDERVRGKGIELLRQNGVHVEGPVLRAECEQQNRGFISVRTNIRPFITLKKAQSKDGSICNSDGSKKKITSNKQDIWSHTNLRFASDAIVVGIGTAVKDNPQLNTRLVQKNDLQIGLPECYRIILDPHLELQTTAKVIKVHDPDRTIIIHSKDAPTEKLHELKNTSIRLMTCAHDGKEFDLHELMKMLIAPEGDFHGITSILVEGGPKTWESFKKAGLMDEDVTLIGD